MLMMDLFRMSQLEISAAHKVRKIYNINRFELWLLMAIIATFGLLGKRAMNEKDLMDEISGHPRQRAKMYGYLRGLKGLRAVCLLDYQNRGTWTVIGVTSLGMRIANEFEVQIEKLAKHRQKVAEYSIEGIELKDGEVPSSRYKRKDADAKGF